MRGGFRGGGFGRGGFGGPGAANGGRDFNQDIYADYSGPDGQNTSIAAAGPGPTPTGPGLRGNNGFGGAAPFAPFGGPAYVEPEPSQQIMVRNVSCAIV